MHGVRGLPLELTIEARVGWRPVQCEDGVLAQDRLDPGGIVGLGAIEAQDQRCTVALEVAAPKARLRNYLLAHSGRGVIHFARCSKKFGDRDAALEAPG